MKKVLAFFLSFLMIFTTTVRPVMAVEVSNDIIEELIPENTVPVDFSYNVVGDTIVFTDEEGHIIELRANDAGSYSLGLAGALTSIGSSGAGAIAAGSATILSQAVPILMFLTFMGVTIYAVEGIRDCVMDMLLLMSPYALAELSELAEQIKNGATQIFFSDSLIKELNDAMGEVFYDDNGYFQSTGITFDPTAMLSYDFNAQYVYGDQLTSTIYKYALSSTPVTFNKTSLSLSLVTSPFEVEGVNKAFKITNSVTGASLIFASSYKSDFLDSDHCTYSVSAPAVSSFSDLDGMVGNILGFWVLKECSIEASGGACSECNFNRYNSTYFGESANNTDINYVILNGTGIDLLDGFVFQSQYYNGPRDWDLTLRTPTDGRSVVQIPSSVITLIASDLVFAIAMAIDAVLPNSQTPVFVPPAQTLDDVNTLTQTGAQTGNWSESVDAPNTGTGSNVSGSVGGILSILASIWDWLQNLVSNLINALRELLETLFVPDTTVLEGVISQFNGKFTWVGDLYHLFEEIYNRLTPTEPPKIPINLSSAESKYDWGNRAYVLDMTWYSRYKDSVDVIISGICWVFFAWRMFKRLPEIINGAGLIEDTISKSERSHRL